MSFRCFKCDIELTEDTKVCPNCKASVGRTAVNNMKTVVPGEVPAEQIVPGVVINDRYEIKKKIGEGGMGMVYLGHDKMLGDDVAIKVVPPELASDERAVADLKRETSVAMKLTHPNIVSA